MRVRRLPVVDEYHERGQVAVFVGGQVLVLSQVATAALLGVGGDWTSLEEVTVRVATAVAPPPDVDIERAVRELLGDLADAGLVEVG